MPTIGMLTWYLKKLVLAKSKELDHMGMLYGMKRKKYLFFIRERDYSYRIRLRNALFTPQVKHPGDVDV